MLTVKNWRWHHIVLAWIAMLGTSVGLLAAFAQKHVVQGASGGSFEVSFVEVVWPLWVLALLAALLVALVTLTTLWARTRRS